MFDAAPEEWREVVLSDVAEIVTAGISADELATKPEVHHYSLPAFDLGLGPEVGPGEAIKSNKTVVPKDCILFSKLNPRIPRIWRVREIASPDSYCSTEFWPLVRKSDDVDLDFLTYFLGSTAFLGNPAIVPSSSTNSHQRVDRRSFESFVLTLPALDEQRRIAKVLRSVDEAIERNMTVIATCERSVAMLATTIAEPTGDSLCVEDFGRIVTGRTPAPSQPELWGGSLPFITPGDLSDGVISVDGAARRLQADTAHGGKVLPAGSVLVTCIGSTVGKTAIARTPCATNQQINAVCCDQEISGYVYLACISLYDEITANAGRQAVPIINKSTFARLPFVRRERGEMIEISSLVDALDSQMQAARSAFNALNRVKEQVAAELLSGRVRVPA